MTENPALESALRQCTRRARFGSISRMPPRMVVYTVSAPGSIAPLRGGVGHGEVPGDGGEEAAIVSGYYRGEGPNMGADCKGTRLRRQGEYGDSRSVHAAQRRRLGT